MAMSCIYFGECTGCMRCLDTQRPGDIRTAIRTAGYLSGEEGRVKIERMIEAFV